MWTIIKNSILKGLLTERKTLPDIPSCSEVEDVGQELKKTILSLYGRSLHLREVDTGSCGACESEIAALSNPVYDIQRFGIDFVASPRHADALVVTGALSRNMALALKRTYEAMPGPKFVITVGDCALDGGGFGGSYYRHPEGIRGLIGAVVLHIPGCPPSPAQILSAILAFLKKA
ncbi:MAG: NADH-quinone oxidoreductase subunit B family protein [Candidatus Velamenicoccus archaeovorus]